jgi:hypothetical protein
MATGLIQLIKTAALEAVENSQMCDLRYGKVINTSPLKVQITNQLVLPESTLIVPERLTNHSVSVTVDSETKRVSVNNALKVGDKVALLRKQGGQSYFILHRI